MTADQLEIQRLRACLKALEESTAQQTVRVDVAIFEKPSRIIVSVTCSTEAREQDIGAIVIGHLENCGLRRGTAKPRKRGKRG